MKIALDAMGGDYAPAEIVKGAVEAVQNYELEVILVGVVETIQAELAKYPPTDRIEIFPASQVIGMNEHPAAAIRKKKDASIVVATRLVKENVAQAVVSAGSTGAQMAAALFGLGRLGGVDRPAIATVVPTPRGPKIILDMGANVDCRAKHLVQFAFLGSVYAEQVLKITRPQVALLNIGEEETKGNEAVVTAYQILKGSSLNFIGNVEGRELFNTPADVIVCDGFVGNVVLKLTEGLASTLFGLLKEQFSRTWLTKLGAALVLPGLKELKRQLDYTEYGGAPLLGVDGVSIICHGSSQAKAIRHALRVARECVESSFVSVLKEQTPQIMNTGEETANDH